MWAFFDRTLASDLLADTLTLFRNNPGLVDTKEAVAKRLGVSPKRLAVEVEAMKRVGLLKEERISGFRILFFDMAADATLSRYVGERLAKPLRRVGKK